MEGFLRLFKSRKPLIGMVHLLPLPGAPRFDGDLGRVAKRALSDARLLAEEGFDGLMVENFGDVPFHATEVGPETVAAIAVLVARIRDAVSLPVGVNVLRNDARSALGIAAATGARFIRVNVHCGAAVTDQGIVEGRAAETLRERARLCADVHVLADVLVKHASPLAPADPELVARETAERGLCDALLVTGDATGTTADADVLAAVRRGAGETPVLLASGLSARNAARLLPLADGAVVGTAVKRGGVTDAPVDRRRARALVAACRAVKG